MILESVLWMVISPEQDYYARCCRKNYMKTICIAGEMKAAWAIDNVFIGAMSMNPATLMDDFETELLPSPWLFINNGHIDEYCTFKRR